MPNQKVIAYFMHEDEASFISNTLPGVTQTESFFIGEASEAQLKALQDRGIVVSVIPSDTGDQPVATRRMTKTRGFRNVITDLPIPAPRPAFSFPAPFLFSMDGPLLPGQAQALEGAGIRVVEFVPPNSYLVRLNQDQYNFLTAQPFLRNLRVYSADDAGVNMIPEARTRTRSTRNEDTVFPFDILLHTAEDLPSLVQWLRDQHVMIEAAGGYKIRVYLQQDSPLLGDIAAHQAVRTVDQHIPPQLHNDVARMIIGVSADGAGGNDLQYEGDGELVGVADTGIDRNHVDLANQIAGVSAWGRANDYSDFNGHGTHVAGSIAGDGTASGGQIRGTAPKAKIFFQSIMNSTGGLSLPFELKELFDEAYGAGARIHNNSWGSSTASKYTVDSIEVDDYVWLHKDMLLVFSAGNDGDGRNPSNVPPGYPDFLSIGSPASAKNVLTVGASRNKRTVGGYASYTYGDIWPKHFPHPPLQTARVSGDADSLAGFSSRGPCDDNRIKPDLVCPGTDIVSTRSSIAPLSNFWGVYTGNNHYAYMGGTSMSAPLVAGCAALVREYYVKMRNHQPSAALLKATLINGCRKLNGEDCVVQFPDLPNYNQGFGIIDMTRTVPDTAHSFFLFHYDNWQSPGEHFKATGQRKRFFVTAQQATWLRVCLAYTDAPGRALQNNLNLLLDSPSRKKFTGNEKVPSLLKMPDTTNNVEAIVVEALEPGTYTVQISATNIIKGPQDFALVITTDDPTTQIING